MTDKLNPTTITLRGNGFTVTVTVTPDATMRARDDPVIQPFRVNHNQPTLDDYMFSLGYTYDADRKQYVPAIAVTNNTFPAVPVVNRGTRKAPMPWKGAAGSLAFRLTGG